MTNMPKEIKIIMSLDEGGKIISAKTNIMVDDEQIGLVQDIKFHASVNDVISNLEITFPDLCPYKTHSKLINRIEAYKELLGNISGVKIHLKKISDE
jgi:hypothetical protein